MPPHAPPRDRRRAPDEATAIIADEVVSVLTGAPGRFDEVRLVGFDEAMGELFAAGLRAATAL